MRGKRAKWLRHKAAAALQELNIDLNEGRNEYDQLENCIVWKRTSTHRMPDGSPAMTPTKVKGTIFHKWAYKRLYQQFKKRWLLFKSEDKLIK